MFCNTWPISSHITLNGLRQLWRKLTTIPATDHRTLNGLRQLWRKLTTIPATDHRTLNGLRQLWRKLTTIPATDHRTLNGLRQLWRKLTTIPATDLKLYYIYYVLQHRDSAQSWVVSWLCSSTETALSHGSFPGCYRVSLSLCCESPAPVANSLFDWIKSLPRFGKNRQWKDHSSQLCKLNLSP